MAVKAIRGAVQVRANTHAAITDGVQELIAAIMRTNALTPESIISVIFTSTADLTAAFPATACRDIGFEAVPLLGAVEVDVPGALDKTIRVMIHANTNAPSLSHIYLHGAQVLRRDIAQ
ncbi:MAG: chorismate mutase [Actinomycetota bacterium]|nr:chorismate mutase [Actinomycetota bacterium]